MLRSRLFFSGSGSWFFFQAAPVPKELKTPGSGSPALLVSMGDGFIIDASLVGDGLLLDAANVRDIFLMLLLWATAFSLMLIACGMAFPWCFSFGWRPSLWCCCRVDQPSPCWWFCRGGRLSCSCCSRERQLSPLCMA